MKQNTFFDFCKETRGFTFHSKKTGYQVYRFELYHAGFNPADCFEKLTPKPIVKSYSLN